MTDIYLCPACRQRRGCNVQQYGPRKMQIWTLRCSNCGHRYVWLDQKAQNVLNAYEQAVRWTEGRDDEDHTNTGEGEAGRSRESTRVRQREGPQQDRM